MPRLWTETIADHRREVRDAILQTTAELVARRGLRSVTMSEIADLAGIGRATLYKYFPDVDAILLAWHERQVDGHLQHLAEVRDIAGDAGERLAAVIEAYALIAHESQGRHDAEVAAWLHRDEHVGRGRRELRALLTDLVTDAAQVGYVRGDVAADELANFCLHAVSAAAGVRSKAAVRRLVRVILTGMRPTASA